MGPICFDSFEAAIAAGSKIILCAQIFILALAPSLLQRTQRYVADIHVYLGWSWNEVRNFGLIAQDPTTWCPAIFNPKNLHFCTFLRIYMYMYTCILGIPMKRSRDIAWLRGNLSRNIDLKWPWPWPWKIAAILKVKNCV